MNQLLVMQPGSTFYHVNLQHVGMDLKEFQNKFWYAVLIKIGGIDTSVSQMPPVLDYTNMIKLELLDFEIDIPVIRFIQPVAGNFLMHNPTSIAESLVEKYSNIRKMQRNDIMNGLCFIRHFKICV